MVFKIWTLGKVHGFLPSPQRIILLTYSLIPVDTLD
jgi:hypothetical protein